MAVRKTTTVKKTTPRKTTARVEKVMTPKAEMRKWEIESALSTLKRADEIRKDSRMMADVKKMAMEQAKMLSNLANGKMK